jgi:hypothetical protein
MILKDLLQILEDNKDLPIWIYLPLELLLPSHFHITEVGRVHKTFIDCGGTKRESTSCVLQIWVANDKDHRLDSSKLLKILKLAEPIVGSELPVEMEYGENAVSQYTLKCVEVLPKGLTFTLSAKKADCLAPDKCGVKMPLQQCCSSGCC